MAAGWWQAEEGQRDEPLTVCFYDRLLEQGSSCWWRWRDAGEAGRCFSPALVGCLRVPCRLSLWASGGVAFLHLRGIQGFPLDAHPPLTLLQQLGMVSVKVWIEVVEDLKKAKETS